MNKKIISLIIIILIAIIGLAILFEDNATISIQTNGVNASTTVTAIPIIHKDIKKMEEEIDEYTLKQENNNESATIISIKEGIKNISKSYGYNEIDINFQSQFGKDILPMIATVSGTSMVPTLNNGDQIIVEKTKNISVGEIVIANDNQYGKIVKRVGAINGTQVYLKSDNTNVEYKEVNGTVYKIEGLKKWTNSSNIIGVVKEYPNQNNNTVLNTIKSNKVAI